MSIKPKIHFQSLEALRFFAFLKVYLLHVPTQGDFPVFSFLKSGGGIGVLFFFVLSGFLITYLLTTEKINEETIDLGNFLVRRSLRIWPLYYLMVIIAFALPYSLKDQIGFHMVGGGYDLDWKTTFTFLQNYKMLAEDNFPKTTPLPVFWTLCIEVQFYLFWGVVLYLLPLKRYFGFLLSCFMLSWVARFIEPFVIHNSLIVNADLFTNLDLFAAGGLVGYFTAKSNSFSEKINALKTWQKYAGIGFALVVVLFQNQLLPNVQTYRFDVIRPTIIAIVFATTIALFIPIQSRFEIKSSVLNYLGRISYGLYVFHIVLIHVLFQYCIKHHIILDNWINLSLFLVITFSGSVLLSTLSYYYFELPFMRLREKIGKKKEIA